MQRLEKLTKIFNELGEPAYRLSQAIDAIFSKNILLYSEITTLPKALIGKIIDEFGDNVLSLKEVFRSSDDQATKILLELSDGERIECVYMTFKDGIRSLCISTQVGCQCKCSFCATGGIGFKRNLTADEVVDQILYALKAVGPVDRITVMGMGEALLNPNLFDALQFITDEKFLNISQYKISVSTVGIIDGIDELSERFPNITLTYSLHFPLQSMREEWMPMAKKYKIDDVFAALDRHATKTNSKLYIAYMLIVGVNDTAECVEALRKIFIKRGDLRHLYHVNVIPFHPISSLKIDETPRANALAFQKKLQHNSIQATVRQSFGKSIDAACGQLSANYCTKPKKLQ